MDKIGFSGFEQKLTRGEYEQLVREIATRWRRLLQEIRSTKVSVKDVLVVSLISGVSELTEFVIPS